MIELYINDYKVDLVDDIVIDFSYETVDPNKLASIKNSFTKSITLPGTPNNNDVFGHLYRMDRHVTTKKEAVIFDPHKKNSYKLYRNGVLVNTGYCVLNNIVQQSPATFNYKITLYGQIGNFFYSLSYNEDGTPKTLRDLYWKWYPKTELYGYGEPMTLDEENKATLMVCSPDIVTQAYHKLDPLYNSDAGFTYIDKEVVFVPCYMGLYNDFDSKHMLVNTANSSISQHYLPDDKLAKFNAAFPRDLTADDKNYTALSSTLETTTHDRYGLVEFSRDLEPYEAGDLRVNELPVAIRLDKMLNVIFNPDNNGGYEVEMPEFEGNDNPLRYAWVLLGNVKQEQEEIKGVDISIDEELVTNDVNYTHIVPYGQSHYNILDNEPQKTKTFIINEGVAWTTDDQYKFRQSLKINVRASCRSWSGMDSDIYTSTNYYKDGSLSKSTSTCVGIVTVVKGYTTPNTSYVAKAQLDLFYFKSPNSELNDRLGFLGVGNTSGRSDKYIKEQIAGLYQYFTTGNPTIKVTDVVIHELDTNYDTLDNYFVKFKEFNDFIDVVIPEGVPSIEIKQFQSVCWLTAEKYGNTPMMTVGMYGESGNDPASYGTFIQNFTRNGIFASYDEGSDNKGYWDMYNDGVTTVYFDIDASSNELLYGSKTQGYNIMNLTKNLLFSDTASPFKYLTDFTKLYNLKYICDDIDKKIKIVTNNYYYYDNVIDINDKVDLGREIDTKPVIVDYKTLDINLETPESYPVRLFNRTTKEKFNSYIKNTNIDYNLSSKNLFDGNIYNNIIEWQQHSVYYNINPQMPRAYNVPYISWNLWDESELVNNELKAHNFVTTGVSSEIANSYEGEDFIPKLALFDNSNAGIEAYPSLIYLNGFVKNYDYTKYQASNVPYTLSPYNIVTGKYAGGNDAQEHDNENFSIYYYYVTKDMVESNLFSYSYDYGETILGRRLYWCDDTEKVLGGEPQAKAGESGADIPIVIPGTQTSALHKNTRIIKMNVYTPRVLNFNLKKDSTESFAIAPRIMFSTDTISQLRFNNKRCYIYDFNYQDTFNGHGTFTDKRKSVASSFVLPYFSKNLYIMKNTETGEYEQLNTIVSSFNINYQDGIDTSMYSLTNTTFIRKPDVILSKIMDDITKIEYDSEFMIDSIPEDNESTRIYDKYWRHYLDNLYALNNRQVTCYVDLSQFNDPVQIMRQVYTWQGQKWIITKLHNYRIANVLNDKFTKVTMIKVVHDEWITDNQ